MSERAARTKAYRELRVNDQLKWYSEKAESNRIRSKQWTAVLVALEALAVILGLARVTGAIGTEWLGVFASAAAAVAAWKQTKNYSSLSEAYAVTSHEVGILSISLDSNPTEEEWAQAVHDAEAAFSREHTLWRARKQGPRH